MKLVYPVVFHKTEDKIPYFVEIPDLNAMTQGTSLENAITMAREIICITAIEIEKRGDTLPKPSDLSELKNREINKDDIFTLIDADVDLYKRKMENRCIRKNCTIPIWLNDEAEKAGLNFSNILQQGLKYALGIEKNTN